jgi:hypothetical protein
MWLLKGILLGLVLFFVGSLIYVGYNLGPFEKQKATGISAITAITVHNLWFWIAFVVALAVACAIVWLWTHQSVVS